MSQQDYALTRVRWSRFEMSVDQVSEIRRLGLGRYWVQIYLLR